MHDDCTTLWQICVQVKVNINQVRTLYSLVGVSISEISQNARTTHAHSFKVTHAN